MRGRDLHHALRFSQVKLAGAAQQAKADTMAAF